MFDIDTLSQIKNLNRPTLYVLYVNNNIHTGYRVHVKYRRDLLFCYYLYYYIYILYFIL